MFLSNSVDMMKNLHGWPGPCLDFGFQYALLGNNGSNKFGVEYWALPGSNLLWRPWPYCEVTRLDDTFRCDPSSVACQSPLWTKMTLSVARHFQVQDKVSTDIVRKDIGGCQTFSSMRLKDIVRCEIFAVVRHLQLSDTFSKRSKRHCLLWDICSCQTFAVVRHFQ